MSVNCRPEDNGGGGGSSWDKTFIDIEVQGQSHAKSDVDWAHQVTTLPRAFEEATDLLRRCVATVLAPHPPRWAAIPARHCW